jgi:hypothetical protein
MIIVFVSSERWSWAISAGTDTPWRPLMEDQRVTIMSEGRPDEFMKKILQKMSRPGGLP